MWGTKEGKLTLKFKDGVVYTMNDPLVIVNGIITGNKVHTFMHHCLIIDETNGIVGDMHFNPWTDNTYKGMVKRAALSFGGLAKKIKGSSNDDPNKKKKRADDVHIQIYQRSDNKQKKKKEEKVVLMEGEGSWLSHLVIDGEVTWRIDGEVPQFSEITDVLSDGTKHLPSSMDNRVDIQPLIDGDYKKSDEMKD